MTLICFNEVENTTVYAENPNSDFVGQFATLTHDSKHVLSVHKTSNPLINDLSRLTLKDQSYSVISVPTHIVSIRKLTDDIVMIVGRGQYATKLFLYYSDSNKLEEIPLDDSPLLQSSNINYSYFDPDNARIYFTTFDHGLLNAYWRHGNIGEATKIEAKNLVDNNIISLNKNKKGDLLIGSYSGLYVLHADSFYVKEHFNIEDGLSSNIVTAAIEDDFGTYWVSTFAGLNTINVKDKRIGQFYIDDGLPYDEFNRNVFLVTAKNHILFGTGNGFVRVDPKKHTAYRSPFQLQFSHVIVRRNSGDERIDTLPIAPIDVAYGNFSEITVFVGNNDWGFTDEVTYFHQIENLETEWSKTKEEKIPFRRMPQGQFNLNIKALSRHGQWSENTLTIPVNVYVPFFKRIWVRVAMGTLVLSMLVLTYLLTDRRRMRQRLDFQKRVSALELSLLQSQMNPHFIFNALGAIQFYIYNNQSTIAEDYLSKFAGLMRMFLESSRSKFISLKDEIKLLRGYIELEHMRFPDKFTSQFNVDLSEGLESYLVPSMMLQPFLENAINHGIFHAKNEGELSVTFTEDSEYLYCAIEDNGIGRKASAALRAASLKSHKSRSTQITEERLEILKASENMHIKISYVDFTKAQDGRTGTRVTIAIPLF